MRHVYVHLPFCSHRCGYCDFVTAVGASGGASRLRGGARGELEREAWQLDPAGVETVFVGGRHADVHGAEGLERVLSALPARDELTVEANPRRSLPSWRRCSASTA